MNDLFFFSLVTIRRVTCQQSEIVTMSAIEAVLSNMTSNNSGNGTEMMTGRELTIGDTIIMAVKAVLGTVAAVQNFTIFLLLLMKKKRVVRKHILDQLIDFYSKLRLIQPSEVLALPPPPHGNQSNVIVERTFYTRSGGGGGSRHKMMAMISYDNTICSYLLHIRNSFSCFSQY